MNRSQIHKLLIAVFLCAALSACIKPYQPDIQQGNIINNSDLAELRYGMSKQEVLFLLGTPLVIDPFVKSRWEYYYSKLNHYKKQTSTRLITVLFEDDKLVEVTGDIDLSTVSRLEPSKEDLQHGGTVITESTQKEKGILNRIFK